MEKKEEIQTRKKCAPMFSSKIPRGGEVGEFQDATETLTGGVEECKTAQGMLGALGPFWGCVR